MKIHQILNQNSKSKQEIIRNYLEETIKPKEGRQHLTWKEERREKALRNKIVRKDLTIKELEEYKNLNYVEIIAEGYCIKPIIRNGNRRTIQTRSMTHKYKEELRKAREESLKNF